MCEHAHFYGEMPWRRNSAHTHDRFLVIASDGVFEFLTNQSVADMVAKYPDPLEACKKVVQESYDLWLQYEVRTDDITIICIYIGERRRCDRFYCFVLESKARSPVLACLALCCDRRTACSTTAVRCPNFFCSVSTEALPGLWPQGHSFCLIRKAKSMYSQSPRDLCCTPCPAQAKVSSHRVSTPSLILPTPLPVLCYSILVLLFCFCQRGWRRKRPVRRW